MLEKRSIGFKIGLFIGLVVAIITLLGIATCGWNPVEGSVVPKGVCKNTLFFYYPFIVFHFGVIILLSTGLVQSYWGYLILVAIFAIPYVMIFVGIGSLISFILRKIRGNS